MQQNVTFQKWTLRMIRPINWRGTAVTCQAALCWTDVADAEVFIAVNVFGTQVTGGHTSWSKKTAQQIPLFIPIPLTSVTYISPFDISSIRHRGGIGLMLVPTESKFLKFVKVPRNIKGDWAVWVYFCPKRKLVGVKFKSIFPKWEYES